MGRVSLIQKWAWGLIFGSSFFSLEAAAPATHVLFAQAWMDRNDFAEEEEKSLFIVGNLFPDIRYLGTVKRNTTHEERVTPEKIRKSSNSFKGGMRLHSFIDDKREAFAEKFGVFLHLKKISKETRVLFLKILEDEIYWDQVQREMAQQALATIHPEEMAAGVEEAVVCEWHQIMSDHFNERPSILLQRLASEKKGYLQADYKTVVKWSKILPQYASNPYFIEYSERLAKHLISHF